MKKAVLIVHAIVASGLSACSSTSTVNVPLSYAKLDTGYVNSGLSELGNVFVWDNKNKVLFDEGHLNVPKELEEVGSTVAVQQATLANDTEIEASADVSKYLANGSLSAAVARNTSTELDNVNRLNTDALSLVNFDNPTTRDWRQKMAARYPGNNYEFFVVDRVISGNKLTVGSNASQSAGGGANIISVAANVKVSVKYDSKDSYTEQAPPGQSVPLVIRGTLLRLGGSASDPAFSSVSIQEVKAFNLQRAMATMP